MLKIVPKITLALLVLYAFVGTLHPVRASAKSMSFKDKCLQNSVESCYIIADGVIDTNTPERFQAFLKNDHAEGFKILLNSSGGNLAAGLKLGRIVRAAKLKSQVGRVKSDGAFGEIVNDARCLSACAYSFLGGRTREVPKGNKIGFHQFYLSGQSDALSTKAAQSVAIASSQKISAIIISYIVEMGVDARIFSRATEADRDEMFYPTQEQLHEYQLVTREGFSAFFLEPYNSGIK